MGACDAPPPPEPQSFLSFGDTLAFIGFIIAVLTWASVPNWWAKAGAVVSSAATLGFLCYKSHFVRKWGSFQKHLAAVIAVGLVASCTWHQLSRQWRDEYPASQQNGEHHPLLASTPQNAQPARPGFLEIGEVHFVSGPGKQFSLRAGTPIAEHVYYNNGGDLPVENARVWAEAAIANLKLVPDADSAVFQYFKNQTERAMQDDLPGKTVGKGFWIGTSLLTDNLTSLQVNGLKEGTYRLYVMSAAQWKDDVTGQLREAWDCRWISGPTATGQIHHCSELRHETVMRKPCRTVGLSVDGEGNKIGEVDLSGCFQTAIHVGGKGNSVGKAVAQQ